MGAGVFEAVARVGVTFAAAFIRADVGFFSWRRKKGETRTKEMRQSQEEGE